MPKPLSRHVCRGLILFTIAPFLLGFEPRRDEGVTIGVGGSAGRGHYSTGCSNRTHRQEYAAGSLSADYTFAHDSARVYRPRVTVGGLLAAAGTETRLVEDLEAGTLIDEPTVERTAAMAGLLLRLDWTYLGLGVGGLFSHPEWNQGSIDAPFLPSGEVRLGPWRRVYATASMGGGFAMPVPVPFDIAFGLGWQGSGFGAWLGEAMTTYQSPEYLLALSYRYRRATVLGSVGLFSEDEGNFPGRYSSGEYARMAFGLRYNL